MGIKSIIKSLGMSHEMQRNRGSCGLHSAASKMAHGMWRNWKNVHIDSDSSVDQVELKTKESGKFITALVYEALVEDYVEDNYWSWIKKLKLRPRRLPIRHEQKKKAKKLRNKWTGEDFEEA
ncbi:hypothetical protein M5K25_007381 [Dendrobium thyrsiflorum]|uniref:Uncharacterized protein n=1 Tax=Dendrobium thyrsiflorum TaxID=117978 RepID=A0ABD0VE03_DENTH